MPIEIEAKMKIPGPEPVLQALRDSGASHEGDHIETDTFFDTKDRTLLAADKGLRLRVAHNLKTNRSHCLLTHKGPAGHGPLKKREETETTVGNPDATTRLLQQLGFVQWLRYQKRRQSWKLDNCKVELDEIPHLGHFVEIEGPSDDAVMRLREKLGLSSLTPIKASYVAMLTAHLQERGDPTTEILLNDSMSQ
ncbi:MAG TPA: class IV adenylate cyclase [Tepidisphaeraceae bacterium]|jgi:adenylate cyclase class 2|nr:class IV adenylate cyclase [Tepidisphaeraceae bacterium]